MNSSLYDDDDFDQNLIIICIKITKIRMQPLLKSQSAIHRLCTYRDSGKTLLASLHTSGLWEVLYSTINSKRGEKFAWLSSNAHSTSVKAAPHEAIHTLVGGSGGAVCETYINLVQCGSYSCVLLLADAILQGM